MLEHEIGEAIRPFLVPMRIMPIEACTDFSGSHAVEDLRAIDERRPKSSGKSLSRFEMYLECSPPFKKGIFRWEVNDEHRAMPLLQNAPDLFDKLVAIRVNPAHGFR